MRSALPLASLALLVALHPARAGAAGLRLDEYVGAEVSPGWFNLASQPVYGHIPTFSAAPVGTLRFARLETRYFYWTPLQLGLGITPSHDYLAHASTEVGKRFRFGHGFVDLGVAAGAAVVVVDYWNDCDGACWAGGGGAMLSPVVRVGYAGRFVSAGLFVRSLLIWNRIHRADHDAYPLLLGVDLALRKS